MAYEKLMVVSGNGNRYFAESVAKKLKVDLVPAECGHFPDSETKISVKKSVRGSDVYLIQSTIPPQVNDQYMELWLLARTLKESDAGKVTAVLPFCGYTRQDKKKFGREPMSMRLIADLCNASGIDRYIFVDLHNPAIECFFSPKPTSNLSVKPLICAELSKREDVMLYVPLSPDAGGTKRVEAIANELNVPFAQIHKDRDEGGKVRAVNVVGDVAGKNVIFIDDMVDTAGTIAEGVALVKARGAQDILVCCTHAVLSDPAVERLSKLGLKELIVTDTIPISDGMRARMNFPVVTLSVAPTIAEVIKTLHTEGSITDVLRD